MKRPYFIFDGLKSSDYGVYISSGMTFNDAEDDFEKVEIPGRSGDLIISNKRFKNRAGEYPAFIFASTAGQFSRKIETFRNAIGSRRGYCKLYDTYNPDTYMYAAYAGGLDIEAKSRNKLGEFTIAFDCKPQRYLMSGEQEITYTGDGAILNPTLFESKPLLTVTGYGTLGIGDYEVEIDADEGDVTYIDCDVMECYAISGSAKTSMNSKVTTGNYFPALAAGRNTITMDATITKLVVLPRWWKK